MYIRYIQTHEWWHCRHPEVLSSAAQQCRAADVGPRAFAAPRVGGAEGLDRRVLGVKGLVRSAWDDPWGTSNIFKDVKLHNFTKFRASSRFEVVDSSWLLKTCSRPLWEVDSSILQARDQNRHFVEQVIEAPGVGPAGEPVGWGAFVGARHICRLGSPRGGTVLYDMRRTSSLCAGSTSCLYGTSWDLNLHTASPLSSSFIILIFLAGWLNPSKEHLEVQEQQSGEIVRHVKPLQTVL